MAERSLLQRLDHAGVSTWVLAGCAGWALLVWAGALAGMGSRIAPAAALPGSALPQAKPVTPDRIGALGQYADAASRPLFTQDRRPRDFLATAPVGDAAGGAAQSLDFILTGVLISPQVTLAIVQPTGGGEAQRVRVGQAPEGASGWRLLEVQPRRAIFEGAGGQSTLDLRAFGEARAAAPMSSRPPPPPPPPVPPAMQQTAAVDGQTQEQRIEAIRKRIEARRAQLQANQNANAPAPSAPPPKP